MSVRAHFEEAVLVATSSIAYVEARAAFSRRRRAGDLSVTEHRHLIGELDTDWARYVRLEVNDGLIRDAAAFADGTISAPTMPFISPPQLQRADSSVPRWYSHAGMRDSLPRRHAKASGSPDDDPGRQRATPASWRPTRRA